MQLAQKKILVRVLKPALVNLTISNIRFNKIISALNCGAVSFNSEKSLLLKKKKKNMKVIYPQKLFLKKTSYLILFSKKYHS